MARKDLICKSIVLLLDYLVFGGLFLSGYTVSLRNAINRTPLYAHALDGTFHWHEPQIPIQWQFPQDFHYRRRVEIFAIRPIVRVVSIAAQTS